MSTERLSARSLALPYTVFGRLRRPLQGACGQHPEECPADSLRAALAQANQHLREKEILLQEQEVLRVESDHRLLNGLQMAVSLLSLQSRSAGTPEVARQLSAAASRVAMIERVHRRLHIHDGDKTVALKKYLEEICADSGEASQLDIMVEGGEIKIPGATAIPLGFIASELITNAVKHGEGKIVLRLDTDRGYALSVCNDGPPLPDGFDPNGCTGLGMKIIRSLVKQIDGEFDFGRGAGDQGARFVVRFS